ncbi:MaoC family dehydratase N-terminal domain-containing protein [Pseudonocardia hispaniensis]|uniref:MaoC family dehydratase N-terminal domain-containing protein n=1 Tax=Pseudonocardia hispaniensis TaxID=904933 RepID=A0ABW1J037_9PSEU
MTGLAEHVAGWAPRPVEVSTRLDRWPSAAFAALLDQPSPVEVDGDPLPLGWHWFHHLEHPAQADLGDDGHPAHGHFLPPIPDRRRMFAGARLEVHEPLRIGAQVVRRSSLLEVTPKHGRSGEMLFLTVRHEYLQDGAVALTEEQDIVYRSQRPGSAPATAPAPVAAEPPPADPRVWRMRLDPDPALLFRFSALTYNAHRIHYDQTYVTGVEGYPGLVVHGPLLALLLLELPRRNAPDRPVGTFEFRLTRPAFAGVPVIAEATPDGERIGLTAGVPGQPASITGSASLRS